MLLLHSLLFSLVSSQDHDCPSPTRPAFIRSAGAIRLPPIVQAKLDMVTCANLCRRNAHPSSEATLPCKGFNFRVGRTPTCEFFSDIPFGAAEPKDYYFYFEKTCLQVPPRCEEATFVLDAKKGVRLRAESQSRMAFSQRECIQACFAEDCPAFEWDERTRACRVYKKTRREYEAIRSEDVVYMENNCIPPSHRCPGARVDFLLARRSDVPSFGVSVGMRSIRGCIQECSDTTLFHCRSFQFDPLSSECFVSDESSEEAVPSKKLDLYEPFCSPESADVSCNRPYAYEKILTTKMAGAREITQHPNSGSEECLGHCSSQRGCYAVNYDVSRRVCHLLDRQRPQGTIGPDENFDFYESACPPTSVSPQSLSTEFRLVAREKSLVAGLRHSSLTSISSLEQCFDSCKSTTFGCKSFSYNPSTQKCFLSTAIITGEAEQLESEFGSKVYALDDVSIEGNFLEESITRYPILVSVAAQLDASSEQNIFQMSSQELEDLTATSQPETTTPIPTLLRSSALVLSEENSLVSELGLMEPGAIPRVAPVESDLGFVTPSSVSVEAECFDNGVNITFTSDQNYTGAVYATERFEQCRILVTKKRQFAIFVTRPSHNTWCNALEFEGQLSVVLVMSNDRVWPLDVTTGKDLFYHISCNYSQSETLHRGIVVGASGPSPIAVEPESVRHSISLQITRKGKPVSNVYIGEPLVALIKVESGVPTHSLRVVDCTAHKVGSTTGSIHLIADGCALLPSLMSSMVLSPRGWEATLSAFRVDDGEQVDIACMVAVCAPGQCSRESCPPRSARSLVNQEAVRIDTRLSVHGNLTSQEGGSLPAICVQPSIYISIVLLLIIFACAALISLMTAITSNRRCRRSITDTLIMLWLIFLFLGSAESASRCNSYFVRWPRVKLNFQAVASSRLSIRACQSACSLGEDPQVPGRRLECAALNHHPSPDGFSHHCDVFQPHQLQNVDGYVEADDRYSFYWKYCLNSTRRCSSDYAFTYLSDRFMDASEVIRVSKKHSLEECLSECLEESSFPCRSISFNRTDGGCHLSANSQLTKPTAVRLNNNPNFRIDYYENNCFNLSETFSFEHKCKNDGVVVKVHSKVPYTGALYGLYDFFTCRIEPKQQSEFELFFPSPTVSKNCSDSIRSKGDDMILEVVLSTDGVEPLYFITPDDLTYQAKCPLKTKSTPPLLAAKHDSTPSQTKEMEASAHALFSMLAKESVLPTTKQVLNEQTIFVWTEEEAATNGQTITTTKASPVTTPKVSTIPAARTTAKQTLSPTTTTTSTTRTTTTTRPTATTSRAITTQKTTTTVKTTTTPSTTRPSSSPKITGPPASPVTDGFLTKNMKTPINFDIYKDGRPVDVVVVGSKITLSFIPHYPIPSEFMSVLGCQVEPIDPKYDWEKEPLPIIKDSCPADLVGLVCPPKKSDYGIKVTVESFRYQTTPQVQYSCLVRVCPFGACPVANCPSVEGCPREDRLKRGLSLEQIREALEQDPNLARQIGISPSALLRPAHTVEQQLLELGGDHVVKRRLVVVNSEEQLRYYATSGLF